MVGGKGFLFRTVPATFTRLFGLALSSLPQHRKRRDLDIIIASGDSHIGYIAMHLARRLRAHFVFDVYDYYPSVSRKPDPGMKTHVSGFGSVGQPPDRGIFGASEALQRNRKWYPYWNPCTL